MTKPLSIGFPSGLFGEEALRLDILQQGDGWFAISKPVQIPFDDHPWQNGETHLIGAIRSQLEMGKPEIVRLGIQEPASAFGPEPEVSGVPLPFISYGGTAMVTLGLGLGILMSIAKAKRLVQT